MKITVTERQKFSGLPTRVPGQYYARNTKYGLVLQSWPRKNIRKKTPGQAYREAEFGRAARWASDPEPGQLDSAIIAAEGTTMVPRDFLTAQAYGTLHELFFEDGTEWINYRKVTINAQLVLDQVTDTPGAMLWRSPDGWIEIVPGSNGQFLRIEDGEIGWVTSFPPAAGGVSVISPLNQAIGVGSTIPINHAGGAFGIIAAGFTATHIGVWVNAAAATVVIRGALYKTDPATGTVLVDYGPEQTGLVAGFNILPLSGPVSITQTGTYMWGTWSRVATWSCCNFNPIPVGWACTFSNPPANPMAGIVGSVVNTTARSHLLNLS